MAKNTSLTTASDAEVPAVILALTGGDAADIQEAMRENFDGESLTAWQLPRAKINPGEIPAWAIDMGEGPEMEKSITGIILEKRVSRAYWENPLGTGGGNTPPDCISLDGITGIGNPGGECATCPLNAFGTAVDASGKQARGKACNEGRQLFVITEDTPVIPILVTLPATSIKPLTKFMMGLATKQSAYWKNVVTLGLEQQQNADGIKYSQLKITDPVKLTPAAVEVVRAHKESIKALLGDSRIIEQALSDDRDALSDDGFSGQS
jgi:hypothetical protein